MTLQLGVGVMDIVAFFFKDTSNPINLMFEWPFNKVEELFLDKMLRIIHDLLSLKEKKKVVFHNEVGT